MNETLDQARRRLEADGIRLVQIEVPELDGALRGKLVALTKGLGDDVGFCTTLLTSTTADDVYEAPFASFEGGFCDFFARPQTETIRYLPWRPGTAAVICDMYDADGTMTPEAPRTALHKAVDRAAAMGFEARAAIAYGVAVFDVAEVERLSGSPCEPCTAEPGNFRSVAAPVLRGIVEAFAGRMAAIGAPLESARLTQDEGALSIALEPAPALEAGDRAMRAKTYLKELCSERGLIASFMARHDMARPFHRGQVSHSLWRDGECAFEAGEGISDFAHHFAAGQRVHLPDLAAFCMPTINAYRRDGRTDCSTATSLVVAQREPGGAFVENRLAGADTNAYLTIAVELTAGLEGIASSLHAGGHTHANGTASPRVEELPSTLEEAADALDGSAFLRSFFGDRFVNHYVFSRRVELRLWNEWLASRVTDWEVRRYFESV